MMQVKPIIMLSALAICLSLSLHAQTDDEAAVKPGDQFSLQGALELFKKSTSPENFEQLLNSADNEVNNLDLNKDGEVDYVRVIDRKDGDVHALALQVPINDKENQDVAVIEIEKTGNEEAVLQIVGDEDIYGEKVIVEPVNEESPDAAFLDKKDRSGPSVSTYSPNRIIVNVWIWPSVRFLFHPGYHVWISPIRWGFWPGWYHPWRPWGGYRFYSYHRPYYSRYSYSSTHRVVRADRYYRPYRSSSVIVRSYHRGGYSRGAYSGRSAYNNRNGRYDGNRRDNNRRYEGNRGNNNRIERNNGRNNNRRYERRDNNSRVERNRNDNSRRYEGRDNNRRGSDRQNRHREGSRPSR